MPLTSACQIEKTSYKGWDNCWRIATSEIELIVTSDVGPRVISCGFRGGQNLFKNFEDQMGKSGEATWVARGGARLWIGPEDREASYAPDNVPVDIEIRDGALVATAPVEDGPRVQKQMIIRAAGSTAEIVHRLKNAGQLPAEFTVWALIMMAPGGVAVTGFPARGTHPEHLLPSNPLIMWRFTDLSDPRWIFLEKYLVLRQVASMKSPQKLGHFNPDTWGAYFLNGDLFIKRYQGDPKLAYPDMGASYETFTNDQFLELETLGPIRRVAPGEWIEHVEHWELRHQKAPAAWTEASLDAIFG
ncbi:MAG TPA: hypothetical protein VMU19_08465 [Bryobacteraceae bacterium]|nr:hypothetical protein [Bryobacteraceae bacterium]